MELHLFSSGWSKYSLSEDEYDRHVMLQVVWKQDRLDIARNIPQLELCNRIPRLMLETYAGWRRKPAFIPCERSASKIETGKWESWASILLVLRLNRKMYSIMDSLRKNKYYWEEQLWWMIAANFGNPVNAAAFEAVARSIPFPLLAKHRQHDFQLEALFMGQANLLGIDFRDPYPVMLRKEFVFLNKKYRLKRIYEPVHFLGMRPEGFPCIRLSQLAFLYANTTAFFSWILTCESISMLKKKLRIKANDYWENHYVFEKLSPFKGKILGSSMCHNIIINSIIPLLYTYGKIIPDQAILKKSIRWLEQMPVEQNKVMEGWRRIGISVKKAEGPQALIELK